MKHSKLGHAIKLPKLKRSKCVTVRLNAAMLIALEAEQESNSLSEILDTKTKSAFKILIKEAHGNE